MNRRELIAAVAAHTGQDPKAIDRTLRGLVDVVSATVKRGDPVVVSGFTKWTMVKRAARTARNPRTGEPVRVKASHRVRITPLKALKDVATGAAPPPKLNKAGPTDGNGSGRSRTARAEAAQAAAAPQAAAASRKATATKKASATKATAKKGTASKAAGTKKATAKKAGVKKASATKAAAKKATTKKASATKAAAKKATAKKATAKKATAKKATAKKATSRGR